MEAFLGDTFIQCQVNHFKRWVLNPHLSVNWTFPSSGRFWLAVGASRPTEILRGLRNLGTPSLNSKNLLLTTRWIYQTSLSKSNCTNLLKLKNSPMKSWWQSEMHRGMRFKIVIWDQVRVPPGFDQVQTNLQVGRRSKHTAWSLPTGSGGKTFNLSGSYVDSISMSISMYIYHVCIV